MELCCTSCGFRSGNAGVFVESSRSGFRRTRCIGCGSLRPDRAQIRAYGAFMVYLFLAVTCLTIARHSAVFGYMWLFTAALYPAGIATAFIHEFGHAAATWLVGGRVYSITVGTGPTIWKLQTPAFELEIGINPFLGGHMVHFYGRSTPRRWKEALILLGGVTANGLVAAALFAVLSALDDRWASGAWRVKLGHAGPPTALMVVLLALAMAQCLAIILNLWPRDLRRSGQLLSSDGKQLLGLLARTSFREEAAHITNALAGMSLLRAGRPEEARAFIEAAWLGAPEDGLLFGNLVHCVGKASGPSAATRLYLDRVSALPGLEMADSGWAFAFGNVAWHALLTGDPEWLPMADRLSERAYAVLPEMAPIKGTRGAALAALGDFETGGTMIKEALPGILDRRDKAEFFDFLARYEDTVGNPALAIEFVRLEQHLLKAA